MVLAASVHVSFSIIHFSATVFMFNKRVDRFGTYARLVVTVFATELNKHIQNRRETRCKGGRSNAGDLNTASFRK